MTNLFRVVVALLIGASAAGVPLQAAAAPEARPLHLLFFGNSFSQQGIGGDASSLNNSVPGIVARTAVADGYAAPVVVADLEGGKNLDYHRGQIASNPNTNVNHSNIRGTTFDYVIMQGFSTEATARQGDGTFPADMRDLFAAVRNNGYGTGVGVRGILYQTWARQPGHNFYPGTYSNAATMQGQIRTGYELALEEVVKVFGAGSAHIAPVGDAFEARGFDASLYDSDRYHASDDGSLLAGLVLYRAIYGEDVSDISWAQANAAGLYSGSAATWESLTATADGVVVVPEPGAGGLLILGGSVMLAQGRRQRR